MSLPAGWQECGAKARTTGEPCRGAAMANGRCRMHGGKAGRPPTHGLRSIRYKSQLAEQAQAYLDDPEPGNLAHELAMARALFQAFSERFDSFTPRGPDVQAMMALLAEISRIVERMAKIEDRHALTMRQVEYLGVRMADILVRYVPADARPAALDALESALELSVGHPDAGAGDG